MPSRLRPTSSLAAEAILVGDPGRALLLAQELLQQPKMSNHARGLWGYTGQTTAGRELTVQSTGMGGPSAAIVLGDLAELGVERAIRVGTCTAIHPGLKPGNLAIVSETFPEPGSPFQKPDDPEEEPQQVVVEPDPALTYRLAGALGQEARVVVSVSLDVLHRPGFEVHPAAEVADMQTAALFATGSEFEIAMAALLIVTATRSGEVLPDDELELAAKRAGKAAAACL
jgi:purine-nucleoside phosphorylase